MQQNERVERFGTVHTFWDYDHDEWLALRHQDITASTVGALFGIHPYITNLSIYAEKIQLKPPTSEDTPLFRRGRWFEATALKASREIRPNWKISEPKIYLRDPEYRIGATPDAEFHDENGELGALQIKTVSRDKFKEVWRGEDGAITPPGWVLMQAYTEASLLAYDRAAVGVLVMDEWAPEMYIVDFPVRPEIYGRIRTQAANLWRDIQDRAPPAPDFDRDLDTLAGLYAGKAPPVDLSRDDGFNQLVRELLDVRARANQATKDGKEVKARIIHRMGDAEAVKSAHGVVKFDEVTRAAYTVEAGSYRKMTVSQPRKN